MLGTMGPADPAHADTLHDGHASRDPHIAVAKTAVDDAFATGETLAVDDARRADTVVSMPRGTTTSRRTVIPRVVEERGETLLVHAVEERYRVDRVIGAGGMGEVARAFDRDIGRTVAVKRMLPKAVGPKLVARFVDEVRTLGRLHHPNIVPIHDVDVDPDGQLFFTMPLVDGQPLDTILEGLMNGNPELLAQFPLSRRLDVFAGIVDALGHAHAQNIVHRDVKPANVMVGPFGEVVLLDWGIARLGDGPDRAIDAPTDKVERSAAKTRHGHLIGTPHYMAPEQARGDVAAIGPATDLYAAFVVLFEMLTLTSYVKEEDTVGALAEVVAKGAPSPHDPVYSRAGTTAVPVELRHLVRHGLAPSPSDRYASASVVLAELARIRSGDFKVECPVSFSKKVSTSFFRFVEAHPKTGLAILAVGTSWLVVSVLLVAILVAFR